MSQMRAGLVGIVAGTEQVVLTNGMSKHRLSSYDAYYLHYIL